jgi:RimJ/RimL family protein N-acetyltransferase
MLPNNWRSTPPEIKIDRLLLRCPQEQDGPELYAAISESLARLRPWFCWTADLDLAPENGVLNAAYARERFLSGAELQFYIFPIDGNALLGICGLTKPDWSVPSFEICYWLRTGYEGHGYMTESITAVTQFAVEQLGAQRIEARCDPANEKGIAVALRAGYAYEKTLPSERQIAILVHTT